MESLCATVSKLKKLCETNVSNAFCPDMANMSNVCLSASTRKIPIWGAILLVVFLVCLSGLFSGLTLGLLSLNIGELNILIKAKRPKIGRYAKRILYVRRHGNWLLCTLLTGNVVVNAALTVLLDDLLGFHPGLSLIISTTLIAFFGEILPQAVCSRKALLVGYYSVPIVVFIMAILAPIAWPLGKLFDFILGPDMGMLYNNAELRELIEMHIAMDRAELGEEQGRIIRGAFDFFTLKVADLMTPWTNVFRLGAKKRLDFEALHKIFQLGFSRIPIVDEKDAGVGALFVKDLVLLDPEDGLLAGEVAGLYGRRLGVVKRSDSVRFVMAGFASGHTHMALVVEENSETCENSRVDGVLGVITLEDIVEKILNFDIVDETDVYVV